ncbi:origin recognition complex subunit 2 isoform X2 [Cimex lectularius]|uniref:Origin recognition complex subunit 2 n=1 Tax=Cimex lectularius TaxID=79782 RepID=A0A8I6RXT3_CIMLE|nr:origin recognition complex subunit 2 isoform X2 [Cimex lectularius]
MTKQNKGEEIEVIFVPDEDVGVVVDCFAKSKTAENESRTKRRLNATPKRDETPKTILTKSGRKVVPKYKTLNVSLLADPKSDDSASEISDVEPLDDCEKPTALYDDDNALGKQLFGFQTPRKRDGMLQKASETVGQLGKGKETPQRRTEQSSAKTPHAARTKIKKRIIEEATRQKLDKLLEESESDYLPTTSSDSDESDSDADEIPSIRTLQIAESSKVQSHKPRGEINHNFLFTSDEYFERKNTRSVTSNHTLSKLKNPKIQQDQLTSLLKSINPTHEAALGDLQSCNQSMFKRWLFSMSEGYNVLVYGVGSKKTLLDLFRDLYLRDCLTIVVNGFFPGITVKPILDCIAVNLLKINNLPALPHEVLEAIAEKQNSSVINRVFIIVHAIDSGLLKCEKNQGILSRLASLPKVHMIASMDHINGPLIWDQKKLSDFNFVWEDATTFEPYLEETSFESSLMVQRSGAIVLSALKNVYQSLTRNTREVFKILLNHQLNYTGRQYPGMLFSELYRQCRDSFIVSSDLALRTQLTEFIDHQIVRWKKDTDHLIIPIENPILKQFHGEIIEEY